LDNDPHHGGQQVLRLRFADGPVILYKPRDVRLDWFLVGANRWRGAESAATRMNRWMATSRRGGGGVPVHGIYPVNETHGYAEWLESCDDALVERARPFCYADRRFGNLDRARGLRLRSEAEARAFWRSAGAMASQLALLGVSDQHVENLLVARAAGAPRALLHPVDCEVAFVVGNGLGVTQLVPDRADQVGVHGATDHTHFGFDVRPSVICSLGAEDWALRRDARGALHLVDPPADIADRWQRHVVRNPDGSFGCTPYLGAILRGVVDHWDAVRAHRDELTGAAARLLRGAAYRVLAKTTAAYGIPLRQREMGCRLWPGAASMRALADGRAFHPSELAQLDLFDVPKYERFVGGRRTIWRPDDSGRDVPAEKAIAAIPTWTSVSGAMHRHGAPGALANALFDVIAFGAPSGAFDLEDEQHGVRVRRASDTAPLELVVARATAVARFRLDADNRLFFSGLPG
ncbi:MAG: DUF4135 domain-containing protein, partial [Gemmatimonadales bacterium]